MDFTTGSVPKQMLAFALPHMLTSALQVAYSAVDLAIVGQAVSGAALAAVSTSSHVLNLLTMLGLGFSTGGQVYMAQALGIRKREMTANIITSMVTAMIAVSVILAAITAVFSSRIVMLLNTPWESVTMAIEYLSIGSIGVIFTFIYNGLAAVMRAHGNSKTPLFAILLSSLVNIILDIVFVIFLKMAVVGAIVATVLGQLIAALILLFKILGNQDLYGVRFAKNLWKPDIKMITAICKLSVPYALEMTVFNISMLFVNSMVNHVDLTASETFGIGLKVEEIGNKLCTGVTCATSVMTAQSVASGNIARTRKIVHTAWIFGGSMYFVFAVTCFCFSRQLFAIFVDDVAVIDNAPMFIHALSYGFPAMASMRATNGLIQGVSNANLSLIIGVLDGIVVRIPLAYILGVVFDMQLWGFFLAYAMAAYTNAVLGLCYYLSKRWEKRELAVERNR